MRIILITHLLFYAFYNVRCGYEDYSLSYLDLMEHEGVQKVSTSCQHALKVLSERLTNHNFNDDDLWALKMMDSTPKLPTGLLIHNYYDYGNFDECIEIDSKRDNIMGKYCLANMFVNKSTIEDPSEYLKNHVYLKNLLLKMYEDNSHLRWAFCLPSNCSNEDALKVINVTDKLGFSVASVSCQTAKEAFPPLDRDGIIGITVFGIIFVLVAISTAIDLYYLYKPQGYGSSKKTKKRDIMKEPLVEPMDDSSEHRDVDLNTEILKQPHKYNNNLTENQNGDVATKIIKRSDVNPIFLAFSLYSNSKFLFRGPNRPSDLFCLNGLRVLSMLWILLTHLWTFYRIAPVLNCNYMDSYIRQINSTIFIGGSLGCDTFLLVGGTLVAYLYFKKDEKNLSSVKGILKHYLHRYIRLTPALLGVILFTITTFKYIDSGPNWVDGTTEMRESCKQYWWSALLYIQNQLNVDSMCIRHSWYINVDMQLYLLSPIILGILKKNAKMGIFAITIAASLSMWVYYKREMDNEMSGAHSKDPFAMFDTDYYKTETRAAPWLMGTILGYFLTKKEYANYKISKKYLIPLWVSSLTLMVLVVIASQPTLRNNDSYLYESALYMAISRPLFALGVVWVIWACATNNGGLINNFLSLPVFNLLNKFIYSVYLLHLMVLNHVLFAMRTPKYFSTFELAYSYCGLVLLTFAVSIFWVLIFEIPMMALEKTILP
ncbi:nose resistant to fluoxetine protein 6-like isoform X1 [Diorhabda carinulata]|uniref:nose resistant to fluoxetine protein 6-like isoform X1 n=1 Tax=Diorhabda carinulata TaxID=1163345 RepID=UPI0025A25AA2|nr:nose resistant to fluoxetine protein 6-like isoform X1 [Diorhabda carinulata]